MARDPIPTHAFSLVIVRRGAEFLLVKERKHGQRWYIPAGRVEPGETLADAAVRETLEESGVPVALDGILRIEHTPAPGGARLRAIFTAHPTSDVAPKSVPDDESLGAAWVTLADLHRYELRGQEVRTLLEHVEAGGTVHPLSLLVPEGTPWPH